MRPGTDDLTFELVGVATRSGLLAASEATMVEVTFSFDVKLPTRAGLLVGELVWGFPIPGTTAALTPLGRHFVRENLLAEGTDAPLAEPVSDGAV